MASRVAPTGYLLAGRYVIERELGRGGNAVVYLARDRKHDRDVAVKMLLPELTLSVRRERFLREVQIAAALTHPHILTLIDSGEANGCLYYVMPLVRGESLRDRLQRDRQLPLGDALRIAAEIADALAYAHGNGVVHRDVKPENILLADGHAMLADFGIARALTMAGSEPVTHTGAAVGTAAYMSPEQSAGSQTVDGRSDVYSLGCVLYEMVAGHPPFNGQSYQEMLARHAMDPVPSLRAARPDLPVEIEAAVNTALAKTPADRFDTPRDFARALVAKPPASRKPRVRWRLRYAVTGVAVLFAGGLLWGRPWIGRAPGSDVAIAVLPFVNMTGDADNEYVSDGITEELINGLAQVPGMRVPPRTSSFFFKDKDVSVREVGDSLNVSSILEGSVRRSGQRLRVTAQLVRVSDGAHLWSTAYDRELAGISDIIAVEEEIARAIVEALQVRLQTPKDRLIARTVADTEAYRLYLLGRFFFHRGTDEAQKRALTYFSSAIARDSSYALAYSGLADVYDRLWGNSVLPREEAQPKASAAAERAVALDSTLAEAYASRGRSKVRRWDWIGAEADLRKAVALNPSYSIGLLWYAYLLGYRERFEEALPLAQRAAALDPFSAEVQFTYGEMLLWAHQYRKAEEQFNRALELEPNLPRVRQRRGLVYFYQGRTADAVREMQAAVDLFAEVGRGLAAKAQLAWLYARTGRRADALRILAELKGQNNPQLAMHIAVVYAGLGEKDAAFAWLERAYQDHYQLLFFLRVFAFFDTLRADPRFEDLARRVGV